MELDIYTIITFFIMFVLLIGYSLYLNIALTKIQTTFTSALSSISKAEDVLRYLYKLYEFIDKATSITDKDHLMFLNEIRKYEGKIAELDLDEHGKFMVLSTTAWVKAILNLKHNYTKG